LPVPDGAANTIHLPIMKILDYLMLCEEYGLKGVEHLLLNLLQLVFHLDYDVLHLGKIAL